MKNGRFTPEEREELRKLPAVDRVTATRIHCSSEFKEDCMRRYGAGEKPGRIFASVGLGSGVIGYKRIESAVYHWKEARSKDAPTFAPAPQAGHAGRIDTPKREKRDQAQSMLAGWSSYEGRDAGISSNRLRYTR